MSNVGTVIKQDMPLVSMGYYKLLLFVPCYEKEAVLKFHPVRLEVREPVNCTLFPYPFSLIANIREFLVLSQGTSIPLHRVSR